jgi:hypothetical protein
MREERARKELAVLVLIKPRALNVEELEARYAARERERVDRELGNRRIRVCVRLVVEDVDGAVSHLKKVDMARDNSGGSGFRRELD